MRTFEIVRSAVLGLAALALSTAVQAADDAASSAPLNISYDMPRDAQLSMGVFDNDGRLLRSIAKADFRRAGRNVERWDGRDQYGKLIPAGEYRVKALYHDPISTEYMMTVGNPGNPAWPTPDGKGDWLSDECPAQAAATDGKWVYLAAPGSELGWSIIAVDENGQRQWGVNMPMYPRCVSLALHGEKLYVLYSGPQAPGKGQPPQGRAALVCLDKKTGSAAGFTQTTPVLKIATFPYHDNLIGLWDLRNNKSYEPGVYGGQPRYFDMNVGESTNALGVAATSSTVYVSMYFDNKVLAFDAVTGAPKSNSNIELAKPVGLYALSEESLLAVSDGKIVKIDLPTKQATPVISSGLAAPHSITVDKAGNIYVSDWKDSFQVKVFSRTGDLLRSIGKPGGRPWVGKWEADGMLLPRGIAVTDNGQLWVAEDDECPKRVSVWNAAGGALIKDYIGPTPYGGGALFWIDPDNSNIAHTLGTRFKLDWQKKTYTPEAVEVRRMSRNQPFAINGHAIFAANCVRPFKRDGKEYVGVAYGGKLCVVLMRKGEIYVPVAAVGGLERGVTDDGTGWNTWDSDIGKHMVKNYWPEFFRGHAGDNYAWSDRNGDGLVQAEEMTWVKTLSRGEPYASNRQPECCTAWGMAIAPDWSIYFAGFCANQSAIVQVAPAGWSAEGVPFYDINKARTVVAQPVGFDGLYVNDEGRIFGSGKDLGWQQIQNKWSDPHPDALSCFAPDGKKLWSMACGTDQKSNDLMASNTIGEYKLPGMGNVVCTWQWWGNFRPYFVSSDGLYVGTALDDDKTAGPAALWGESYNYFYQSPDGTPYIVNGANDGHHILRVRGLEKGGRFESKLVVTEADAKLAAAAQPVVAGAAKVAEKPVIGVRWLEKSPAIDGNLSDWNMNEAAGIDGGNGRTALVALRRDAKSMYLAYHVNDDTPLLNKGSNWQSLFISGDCVDLMLAGNPKADPNRGSAVAGDIRVLFGSFQNEPIAVLYRPVDPGATTGTVQLMAARFDRVEKLTAAKVAFRRGKGFYDIEAAVPLKTLGISPDESGELKGDAGVIFSDATGNDRIKRAYHYNQKTQMISDLTTEATLQPAEWGAVRFPLGPNLLKDGGFEDPLAARPQDGWCVQGGKNGVVAELSTQTVHSGRQSLLLRQAPAGTSASSKGNASAGVAQQVPVVAGRKYSLRFFWRTQNLKAGSGTFHASIRWVGQNLKSADISNGRALHAGFEGGGGGVSVCDVRKDSEGWAACYDLREPNWYAPKPYVAPEGATAAVISFNLDASPSGPSTVDIDDVEFMCEQ